MQERVANLALEIETVLPNGDSILRPTATHLLQELFNNRSNEEGKIVREIEIIRLETASEVGDLKVWMALSRRPDLVKYSW